MIDLHSRRKYFYSGIVILLLGILLLWAITSQNFSHVVTLDSSIKTLLDTIKNPVLDSIVIMITNTGNTTPIIVFSLVVVCYLIYQKFYSDSIFFAVNLIGVWVFNVILKQIFVRPRPSELHLVLAHDYSFPSGHAMISLSVAIALVSLMIQYISNRKIAYPLCVLVVGYALLIGVTRVYVGVHYSSDVLGGWIFAILWFLVIQTLFYNHK